MIRGFAPDALRLRVRGRLIQLAVSSFFLVLLPACRTIRPDIQPPDPMPLAEAAAVVNRNIALIPATLRAIGPVDGHVTLPERGRRTYHLDGVLFFRAPRFFRFDLKGLGETQILIGSNHRDYWCFSKFDETTVCGRHGAAEDLPQGLPARPDQLIDALGLTPIPVPGAPAAPAPNSAGDHPVRVVQRVVEHVQQLLFLIHDGQGNVLIEKEYWVDRYPPHFVRKVIFRDADGVVEMESTLEAYQSVGDTGLQIPHRMTAEWPRLGARLRFDVRKWTLHPQIGPAAPQFVTPTDCPSDPFVP
jgi:hypothetical protein